MKNYLSWLSESNMNDISIDTRRLQKQFEATVSSYIQSINDRHEKVLQFDGERYLTHVQYQFKDYPLIRNFISALQSKNKNYVFDQTNKLREWLDKLPNRGSADQRRLTRDVWVYLDSLEPKDDMSKAEQEIVQLMKTNLHQSIANMQQVQHLVQEAVSRVEEWHNTKIIIEPMQSNDETGHPDLEPATTAEIHLISNDGLKPSFVLFQNNGQIEIDDVLDSGDEDFFSSNNVQTDYFNLINEIKKPGSTSTGKTLTLYTARPSKDRSFYFHADKIPVNVFLTNSLSHASGLASDLGNTERRDIWKVRVNDKYLTKTLDGNVKYYQVTSSNAKASFSLIESN